MSRGTTKRSEINPIGADTFNTALGNVMLERVMLLMRLAHVLGHMTTLEQPVSSIMYLHKRFQQLICDLNIWVVSTALGFFGGETLKPVHLYSNSWRIHEINDKALVDKKVIQECAKTLVNRTYDGEREKVRGLPDELKSSQSYPVLFGTKMAELYAEHRAEIQKQGEERIAQWDPHADSDLVLTAEMLMGNADNDEDRWPGAKLQSVFRLAMSIIDLAKTAESRQI